ncbi:hypothetical protein [Nitrosomonas sp.]|uniref:hypothetical protein n=1 Tax=Nitrosomonas sp. TaxID=42353 RepID=UPI0025857DD2|nr:hypothetical protein [Nitrosomonas sp.]
MNDAKMSQTEKLPCLFVIFGATGDLASNKLLPALFELENAGRLADNFSIVAFSRREWTTDDWLEHLREILKNRIDQSFPEGVLERFFADRSCSGRCAALWRRLGRFSPDQRSFSCTS